MKIVSINPAENREIPPVHFFSHTAKEPQGHTNRNAQGETTFSTEMGFDQILNSKCKKLAIFVKMKY